MAILNNDTPMTFWQRLWRAEMAGVVSLLAFCVVLALLLLLEGLIMSPRETDALEMFLLAAALGLFYGLLPVVLLGAPAYVALSSTGRVRWLPLIAIVVLPGLVMLFYHRGLGMISIAAGPTILFLTHRLFRWWSRSGS